MRSTAAISRRTAAIVLLGLAALLIVGLITPSVQRRSFDPGRTDVALFETVVERMRTGEPYYDAFGSELRARGYPTASVFNWRMPFPLKALATWPRGTAVTFLVLGLAVIAVTILLVLRASPGILLLAVLGQLGVIIPLLANPLYALMAEGWAGLLIMLSLAAYARRLWSAGAALGVLAVLTRELAAPYCVVAGVLAVKNRRWREFGVWTAGGLIYGAYLLIHVSQVSSRIAPSDLAHDESWIQFGGLPFLLRIVSFTGWYDVLPLWTRAVGCMLIAASLWAPSSFPHLRWTVAAYLLFFLLVGQPFNQYWALMVAPLFAVATGYGLDGISWLVRRVANQSSGKMRTAAASPS